MIFPEQPCAASLLDAAETGRDLTTCSSLPLPLFFWLAGTESRGGAKLTPLLLAAEKGHMEVARLLLSYGADINALDEVCCVVLWCGVVCCVAHVVLEVVTVAVVVVVVVVVIAMSFDYYSIASIDIFVANECMNIKHATISVSLSLSVCAPPSFPLPSPLISRTRTRLCVWPQRRVMSQL